MKAIETLPALEAGKLGAARGATLLFLAGIAFVIGICPELRPSHPLLVDGQLQYDRVDMAAAIMIVMLAIAGLMMLVFRASAEETVKGAIMRSGVVAFVSILGIAWLGSSFFEHNREVIVGGISGLIEGRPWIFAFGLFALSVVLFSQAATYGTVLAAVSMDQTGTMRIGRYVLNHSFMIPGLVTTASAVGLALLLSSVVGL